MNRLRPQLAVVIYLMSCLFFRFIIFVLIAGFDTVTAAAGEATLSFLNCALYFLKISLGLLLDW